MISCRALVEFVCVCWSCLSCFPLFVDSFAVPVMLWPGRCGLGCCLDCDIIAVRAVVMLRCVLVLHVSTCIFTKVREVLPKPS